MEINRIEVRKDRALKSWRAPAIARPPGHAP